MGFFGRIKDVAHKNEFIQKTEWELRRRRGLRRCKVGGWLDLRGHKQHWAETELSECTFFSLTKQTPTSGYIRENPLTPQCFTNEPAVTAVPPNLLDRLHKAMQQAAPRRSFFKRKLTGKLEGDCHIQNGQIVSFYHSQEEQTVSGNFPVNME